MSGTRGSQLLQIYWHSNPARKRANVSVKTVFLYGFFGRFGSVSCLHTSRAEESKSAGDGHDVSVVLCFHLRQEGLRHLSERLIQ